MHYINKKLGIKVVADSSEEAKDKVIKIANEYKDQFCELKEPIVSRKDMKMELFNQDEMLVTDWCLCWYLSKVKNKHRLLNSEKNNLINKLIDLNSIKLYKDSTNDAKKDILKYYLVNMREYDKDVERPMLKFGYYFGRKGILQNIPRNYKVFITIGKMFAEGLDKLIDVIAYSSKESIVNYVNETFSEV